MNIVSNMFASTQIVYLRELGTVCIVGYMTPLCYATSGIVIMKGLKVGNTVLSILVRLMVALKKLTGMEIIVLNIVMQIKLICANT